jgi:hypothetical protein
MPKEHICFPGVSIHFSKRLANPRLLGPGHGCCDGSLWVKTCFYCSSVKHCSWYQYTLFSRAWSFYLILILLTSRTFRDDKLLHTICQLPLAFGFAGYRKTADKFQRTSGVETIGRRLSIPPPTFHYYTPLTPNNQTLRHFSPPTPRIFFFTSWCCIKKQSVLRIVTIIAKSDCDLRRIRLSDCTYGHGSQCPDLYEILFWGLV